MEAMETRPDELGTVRHDWRLPFEGGFREVRTYSFPGGCVAYRIGFGHDQLLVGGAWLAVGFITRGRFDANARRLTNGAVDL